MTEGKADCGRLLEMVHRAAVCDQLSLADATRLLADVLGDVAIGLIIGIGQAGARIEAVSARVPTEAASWREILEDSGSLIHGGLGQTVVLGRPRVLEAGPWPTAGSPEVQVLFVPVRTPNRIAGVIGMLRQPGEPAFSQAEVHAVEAIAARAGSFWAVRSSARQSASDRQEFDLLRSSLRLLARHLESDVALQPLLVQARQALGAANLFLLLHSGTDPHLHLEAASGPSAPPADAAVAWALDTTGALAASLAEHRSLFVADQSALAFPEGPFRTALGSDAGPLLAAPVQPGAGPPGVLVVTWPPGCAPTPELKALAGHVAELAAILVSHARLTREAVGARAAKRVAGLLASHRDAIVRQIVHDLRNAVHALGLAAEDMEYKSDDPARVRSALGTVTRQTDFMASYLKEKIRSLESQPLEAPPPGSLETAFGRLEGLVPRIARDGRTLRVGRLDPVQLKISQIQLDQILERLVFEASQLANPGGTLEVWGAVADGWATIMVEDDGPGVDVQARAPAASARARRDGSGPGIRAVEELVAAAGGQFGFRSRPGDRTSFHVGLPAVTWAGGA